MWLPGATWLKSANSILSKGQQVYIEGRLQTRNWDDSEGNKHTSVEIVANEMIMLSERREAEGSSDAESSKRMNSHSNIFS